MYHQRDIVGRRLHRKVIIRTLPGGRRCSSERDPAEQPNPVMFGCLRANWSPPEACDGGIKGSGVLLLHRLHQKGNSHPNRWVRSARAEGGIHGARSPEARVVTKLQSRLLWPRVFKSNTRSTIGGKNLVSSKVKVTVQK